MPYKVLHNLTKLLVSALTQPDSISEGTGRYKVLTIVGTVLAMICYVVLIIPWHGNTNMLESLYIVPGGWDTGIVMASTFIYFSAHVEPKDMAVTTAGAYLATGLAQMLGVSLSSASLQIALLILLGRRLQTAGASRIIEDVLERVENVRNLEGPTRLIVLRRYTDALSCGHGVSLILAVLAFIATLTIKERRLK